MKERFNPTMENLEKMESLFKDFLFDQEIAEKMGASLQTIKRYREQFNRNGRITVKEISSVQDTRREKIKTTGGIIEKPKNAKTVLAFDQSSRLIGYSVWEAGSLTDYGVVDFAGSKNVIHRLHMISKWLKNFIEERNADIIYFEDIQLEHNVGLFKTLSMVLGVCKLVAHSLDISYESVYSSEWRKFCGIKGQNRQQLKRSAQQYVLKEFGIKVTDDEAEAICIGKYGSSKINEKTYLDWD